LENLTDQKIKAVTFSIMILKPTPEMPEQDYDFEANTWNARASSI